MKFCSLYSGSSGNSIFISTDNTRILIDAGLPGKKIDAALKSIGENSKDLDGIFVTHEHSDHIKGIGVFFRSRSAVREEVSAEEKEGRGKNFEDGKECFEIFVSARGFFRFRAQKEPWKKPPKRRNLLL